MKNISYQTNGSQILVFVEGKDKADTEAYFNMFWNWKATNAKPNWLFDDCITFWTDRTRFHSALTNIALMRLLRDEPEKHKGKKGGALELAKKHAVEMFAEMKQKHGYLVRSSIVDYFDIGVIKAEKPDEFCEDKDTD